MIWLKENDVITNNKIIIEKNKLKELNEHFKELEKEFGNAVSVSEYKIPELYKGFYFYDNDFQKRLYYSPATQCYYMTRTLLEDKKTNINLNYLVKGIMSSPQIIESLIEKLDKNTLRYVLIDMSSDLYYFCEMLLDEMSFNKEEEIALCDIEALTSKSKSISALLQKNLTLAETNTEILTLSKKIHNKLHS